MEATSVFFYVFPKYILSDLFGTNYLTLLVNPTDSNPSQHTKYNFFYSIILRLLFSDSVTSYLITPLYIPFSSYIQPQQFSILSPIKKKHCIVTLKPCHGSGTSDRTLNFKLTVCCAACHGRE